MKVTAILPDDLVSDVQKYTGGKNITDSLIKALNDWIYSKRIEELNANVVQEPLEFRDDYTAKGVRKSSNRQ